MQQAALLSVSDRTGLVEFAKSLEEAGLILLTTSGTGKYLKEAGISSVAIEDYTGQKEILDGRVKTLHPRIHAGLLAKRDNPQHLEQLASDQIYPIAVAVVNLYPFIQGLQTAAAVDPAKMIELIDIGGPTMIRAAAKNFNGVYPVIDPRDYPAVTEILKGGDIFGAATLTFRRQLAAKVFTCLANYNLEIGRYLSGAHLPGETVGDLTTPATPLAAVEGWVLTRAQELRYGENPQQKAGFYTPWGQVETGWQQLQGKELSYNNLLDFDAACRVLRSFQGSRPTAVLLKHLNPCGAAQGASLLEALERAKQSDPRSHFGGIVALNQEVPAPVAENITGEFAELVQQLPPDTELRFRRHPAFRHYQGCAEPPEWLFPEVSGYFPSFSAYWKQCSRHLKALEDALRLHN